jgi:hypothetical protein
MAPPVGLGEGLVVVLSEVGLGAEEDDEVLASGAPISTVSLAADLVPHLSAMLVVQFF